MGKGRKPKPPALRLLDGRRPETGIKLVDMAIGIAPGSPDCPSHLNATAAEHWHYIITEMGASGVIERVDLGAFAAACVAYSRALEADRDVNANGILIPTEKGVRKNPAVSVSLESWAAYLRFAVEFGLTPSSRAKVRKPQSAKVDEFEAFQKQA